MNKEDILKLFELTKQGMFRAGYFRKYDMLTRLRSIESLAIDHTAAKLSIKSDDVQQVVEKHKLNIL